MFRAETTSVRMLQAVSVVASLAVLLWSLGLPSLSLAEAASLTSVSNTLSDSDLGVVSNHQIQFTIPSGSPGVASGETIVVTFPNGFNLSTSSVAFGDIDLEINGTDETLVAAAPTASQWSAAISGQDLTFTSGGANATATEGEVITIKIGTNADGGTTQVPNHAGAGAYEFNITAGSADTGATRVVILNDVVVTAAVDTVFNFTVGGFSATGIAINGTTTTATSSATSIPFGTLTAGTVGTAAQLLNVSTNAAGGFVVTVEQSGDLMSATGADINGFANGAYTNTPTAWSAPSATVGSPDTYGHWGLTSSDDLNSNEFFFCAASSTFGCWVAASTTPRQVFHNSGVADGSTEDVGSTTVGYQIEISALQEAADDYSTELTYIATPTF